MKRWHMGPLLHLTDHKNLNRPLNMRPSQPVYVYFHSLDVKSEQ